jgi:hypothetical protein
MYEMTKLDADIGSMLVEEAQKQRKNRFTEQCVGEVETVMRLIEITEGAIKTQTAHLDIYKRRLDAIKTGEIYINHLANGAMTIGYHDKELRAETVGY